MIRFNKDALDFLSEQSGDNEEGYSENASDETLGDYLKRKAYAQSLINYYIMPVCAAVWSCPREQVLSFPAYFILTFMKNHHLLQINGRPQWYTIAGKENAKKRKMLISTIYSSLSLIHLFFYFYFGNDCRTYTRRLR